MNLKSVPRRLVEIESICRRENKWAEKLKIVLGRAEWLSAFSPFPAMFSKGFFLKLSKVGIVW